MPSQGEEVEDLQEEEEDLQEEQEDTQKEEDPRADGDFPQCPSNPNTVTNYMDYPLTHLQENDQKSRTSSCSGNTTGASTIITHS